jgi:hypothetical protein
MKNNRQTVVAAGFKPAPARPRSGHACIAVGDSPRSAGVPHIHAPRSGAVCARPFAAMGRWGHVGHVGTVCAGAPRRTPGAHRRTVVGAGLVCGCGRWWRLDVASRQGRHVGRKRNPPRTTPCRQARNVNTPHHMACPTARRLRVTARFYQHFVPTGQGVCNTPLHDETNKQLNDENKII